MTTKLEVLQACTVQGNIIKLPDTQLDRKLYLEVAKALELIGGKWKGGKTFGFVFNSDPTELLEELATGGNRNLKKEYQFFATPDQLADELVQHARIQNGDMILEPSAGQGAIVKAIQRRMGFHEVWGYELMPQNRLFLDKIPEFQLLGDDFLTCKMTCFDKVIANPPFTKNQDIDHIRKMYDCLDDGGRLVSLASISWEKGSQRKQEEFKDWLDELNAEIHDVPPGAFKESGTAVGAKIIIIDK